MAFRHDFDPTSLREYDIRGIVGRTLHPADAYAIGRCFATMVARAGGSTVAVGYDGRVSSPDLEPELVKGYLATVLSRDATVDPGPLLPKLTSAGAGPVAQALNHVASLGLGYQPSSGTDVQSVSFDLTPGVTPAFQSSTDPNAFSSLSGTLGDTNWWDSAKNDAESAFHGLRHGVITFKHMVSSWDKDAEHWVVNLTVDIGDGIDNLMTYVISDLKTAIHAISSFFQALGADLKHAWEWLKHFVLGVNRDDPGSPICVAGIPLDLMQRLVISPCSISAKKAAAESSTSPAAPPIAAIRRFIGIMPRPRPAWSE